MRKSIERPEGINAGCALLVGAEKETIFSNATKLLDVYCEMAKVENPYGDGRSSERIVEKCENLLG